eukprot:5491769-Pleurochrysis_carterae.AAC.1
MQQQHLPATRFFSRKKRAPPECDRPSSRRRAGRPPPSTGAAARESESAKMRVSRSPLRVSRSLPLRVSRSPLSCWSAPKPYRATEIPDHLNDSYSSAAHEQSVRPRPHVRGASFQRRWQRGGVDREHERRCVCSVTLIVRMSDCA